MKEQKRTNENQSFLDKLLSVFFPTDDEDRRKRKILRSISKEISKSKFDFFRIQTMQFTPSFAAYFFEFYKLVAPSQVFLRKLPITPSLKDAFFTNFLTDEQKSLLKKLSEEEIVNAAKFTPLSALKNQVASNVTLFRKSFNRDSTAKIDGAFSMFLQFRSLMCFDYYSMMRKFSPNMKEFAFGHNPSFNSATAVYVMDLLQDFLGIAWGIQSLELYNTIFSIVEKYKQEELINRGTWTKILGKINEMRRSGILENIARFVLQDVDYNAKIFVEDEKIVDSMIQMAVTQAEGALKKIENEQRSSQVSSYLMKIFGKTDMNFLANYTGETAAYFISKGLCGYEYTLPLNYLTAFLIDYCKKSIRELEDLILVRGQWAPSELNPLMSNSFFELMALSDAITKLDNRLSSEDGELGTKLRNLAVHAEHKKESRRRAVSYINEINSEVFDILSSSVGYLQNLEKAFSAILEDIQRQKPELIQNWGEIAKASNRPIKEFITEAGEKCGTMVKLLEIYVNKPHDERQSKEEREE